MERFAIAKLSEWKESKNREPLILCGAANVGKSYILHEFGARFFDSVVYIDFENKKELKSVFKRSLDVSQMLMAFEMATGERVNFSKSLIVLDEIEDVPYVFEAVKILSESIPQLAVVCSISKSKEYVEQLLEKEQVHMGIMPVYPMTYEEFVGAVYENITDDYRTSLLEYCLVGGMPEIVDGYIRTGDIKVVRLMQKKMVDELRNDIRDSFSKPAAKKILQILDALCSQLSKTNKKFMYSQIKQGARAKEFEPAVRWLSDRGYIYIVNRAANPEISLQDTVDTSAFKIFFYDTGLFMELSDDFEKCRESLEALFDANNHAAVEEYVLTQFVAGTDFVPYYYSAEYSKGEISFVFDGNSTQVPVDVMGTENLQAKSLKAYRQKYKTNTAVRMSLSPFEEREWMINVPLNNVKYICDMLYKPGKQDDIVIEDVNASFDELKDTPPIIEEAPILDMPDNVDNAVYEETINESENYQIQMETDYEPSVYISGPSIENNDADTDYEPSVEEFDSEEFDSDDFEIEEFDSDDFEIEDCTCTIFSEEETESIEFEEPLELGLEIDSDIDFGGVSDFTSLYNTLEEDPEKNELKNDIIEHGTNDIPVDNESFNYGSGQDEQTSTASPPALDDDFAEFVWTEEMIKKYT